MLLAAVDYDHWTLDIDINDRNQMDSKFDLDSNQVYYPNRFYNHSGSPRLNKCPASDLVDIVAAAVVVLLEKIEKFHKLQNFKT